MRKTGSPSLIISQPYLRNAIIDPINNKAMRSKQPTNQVLRDNRLPIPGTIITKTYKEIKIQVKVLDNGFEYKNKIYKTLTAIAKEITGSHWNGFLFFNL